MFTARYELNVSVQFREIAQEVRRRSPTSEAWFRSQHNPCEIFGGQSSTGTGICPSTSVFPCQHHSTSAVYSSSSTCYSYQKDKRVKSWNLPKTIAFPVIGVLDRKFFHVLDLERVKVREKFSFINKSRIFR